MIILALLIVIVYLSSGLYALIDVIEISSDQVFGYKHDMTLWPLASSPWITIIGWMAVTIYLLVVLSIIIVLCGIQLKQLWLIFTWSILMIILLFADGIVTIFSLREHQEQHYRSISRIKILFIVMTIRLTITSIGILVAFLYFRQLQQIHAETKRRQKVFDQFNTSCTSTSSSNTWTGPSLNTFPKRMKQDDLSAPLALPRAKLSTVRYPTTSSLFKTYRSPLKYVEPIDPRPHHRSQNDFRYNIPLQERFYQPQAREFQKF